jgi:integrase
MGGMMQKKPYSLWKRRLKTGRYIWYVRFRLDEGCFGTAKSSGQSTKTAAEAWAINYLRQGQVVTRENISFAAYASDFFSPKGDYMRTLELRGKRIGQRHLANQQSYLTNYLIPSFGQNKLRRIDTEEILEFSLDLRERGLSASTINHILLTLRIILNHAYRKKFIQTVPEIDTVVGVGEERGVLKPEEVAAFFNADWHDSSQLAINLIAATTGMRLGEILALKRNALHPTYIEVKASWERGFGLKGTKTGRNRYLPLTHRTNAVIGQLLAVSPYTEPEDFVFFGRQRGKPLDHKTVQKSFNAVLALIGISELARVERRLSFHSWRHFFNSLLINSRVPVQKVQTLTGHSTDRMTEKYFHVDDYRDVLEIMGKI